MLEKVYAVNSYWDMTILEGVAGYNGRKYYFNCIFSNDDVAGWNDAGAYELTLLDDCTFSGKIDGMDTNVEWENVVKI
jgi:hypothetical protein